MDRQTSTRVKINSDPLKQNTVVIEYSKSTEAVCFMWKYNIICVTELEQKVKENIYVQREKSRQLSTITKILLMY